MSIKRIHLYDDKNDKNLKSRKILFDKIVYSNFKVKFSSILK